MYIQVNGKGNLESKNKSDIIKSRNATIDKEIKENVLKDVKHNSGLGTVGKRTLRNLGLDENLNFEMMDARGSVSSDCDIELTKVKKLCIEENLKR